MAKFKIMTESILFFISDTVPSECQFESETDRFLIVDKFEWINNEIDRLTNLQENWDGQGSLPVLQEVGEISKRLFMMINSLDGITDIFPNPHGTVTIEWTNNKKEKLALEIGANSYSYFVKYSDKKPKLVDGKDILTDTQMLTKDLGELFSEEILNFIL
jgi:hypothetical protein